MTTPLQPAPKTVLVTGGTGKTGTRVARRLGALGHAARVAARAPGPDGVRFDWTDPATHADALAGVDAVYLVAARGRPGDGRGARLLAASRPGVGGPPAVVVHAELLGGPARGHDPRRSGARRSSSPDPDAATASS